MKPMGLVEPCIGEATAASKAWATLLKPCNISYALLRKHQIGCRISGFYGLSWSIFD